ncbi:hypothetical protein PYW07_014710 [Mythimna separata]|uniref:Uncharacterized protein n=1 Tax=Mythimna separata TaxID=271217 RepID=A0AAD7Z1J1_MYTSE|nr:hypothetical protein PYW07_014710 [Mythimna separata]
MTTGVNIAKLANVFRGRWMMIVHELTEIYKPAISRNREKLMEVMKEKAEAATKSELAKTMRGLKGFYTLEMAPPRLSEMEKLKADLQLMKDFFKNKCFLHITVKQAWLLFLVGLEVFLWFFLGETIGKGHIVGYKV